MFTVMLQMALLIAVGTCWQRLAPQHIPALAHRRALTDLVFFILLPAMVLDIIWRSPLDITSIKISMVALSGLGTAAIAMWSVLRYISTTNTQKGALMLAAIFPNATYLGLPVLNGVMGPWTNAVALQFDLFACTPVLLILGILMANHFGSSDRPVHPLRELSRVPPLWAVVIALLLNLLNVPQPDIIHQTLFVLSGGVVPLMLIALGMSIRWDSMRLRFLPLLLPVVVISLVLAPTAVWLSTSLIGIEASIATALILLSAMPTMVFGLVICERYQLDSTLYAAAVTLTTVCSLITLPLWYHGLPLS